MAGAVDSDDRAGKRTGRLEPPKAHPITARLVGAGSPRRELEAPFAPKLGVLAFRIQADVVELRLPSWEEKIEGQAEVQG